jgi:hypothetical protein
MRRGQLHLLPAEPSKKAAAKKTRRPDWTLDEKTRRVGREGIAAVRETLRRARPPEPFQKAS